MSGPSVASVLSALFAILGLVILLPHAIRKWGRVGRRSGVETKLEVVARAGLGPKQGIAAVRVGERIVVVSYGEGGVRRLADLDSPESSEPAASAPPALVPGGDSSSPHGDGDGAAPFAWAGPKRRDRSRSGSWTWMVAAGLLLGGLPAHLNAQAPGANQSGQAPSAAASQIVSAQGVNLSFSAPDREPLTVSGPVGAVLFVGMMTLIPTLLLITTSFTRILIVLHLLKQALGTQTAPPAHLLTAMSVLLTAFVMAPTFEVVNETALTPWMAGEVDEVQMLKAASVPMREFMLQSTRDQDLDAFIDMRGGEAPETIDDVPFVVVTSAFVTSELTAAFQMGFAIFLPFIVIDIVVASVLMSMGMFMLPPVMVSLPFKLLLFVLVDGWSLIMSSLVQSFQ